MDAEVGPNDQHNSSEFRFSRTRYRIRRIQVTEGRINGMLYGPDCPEDLLKCLFDNYHEYCRTLLYSGGLAPSEAFRKVINYILLLYQ
jgi:hypothetical protein